MSLATNSLTKNSWCSLLLSFRHPTPEKSMAIAHVPLSGCGQAEMAKDEPQGLSVEMGSPVLPAARCLLSPGVHKALSSPPKPEHGAVSWCRDVLGEWAESRLLEAAGVFSSLF